MVALYIIIGILIMLVFALFIMLIISFRERNRVETAHARRTLVMDTHYRSEKRFLTLLLLEAKGVNTGIKSEHALYQQFLRENKDLDKVELYAQDELNKAKDGQE